MNERENKDALHTAVIDMLNGADASTLSSPLLPSRRTHSITRFTKNRNPL